MNIRASLDIGTNSVKLLVLGVDQAGGFKVLADEAVVTGLGRGVAGSGRLSEEGIEETMRALRTLVTRARALGAMGIRAAGTAALRDAVNRDEFLGRARVELGLQVAVLSADEEARLARAAALRELAGLGRDVVFFDVGGGSTELTWFRDEQAVEACSMPLGARVLTELAQVTHPVSADTARRTEEAVRHILDEAAAGEHGAVLRGAAAGRPVVAGLGGTATTVVWLLRGERGEPPGDPHGAVATAGELAHLREKVGALPLDGVRELPNIDPARADVIYAGMAIIAGILAFYGAEHFRLIDRGLRWGLLLA
jgi:exopolyphosphatase/guanosine-5'-triphosphate,3'-diphosphate pyrophosphatase